MCAVRMADMSLILTITINPQKTNTVGACKHDTLRNKVKQKQFFHSFIIFSFYNYTYNVERAYI